MRSLLLITALALGAPLPATAGARPLEDPPINAPAPQVTPADDGDGGGAAVGYVLVGLGGLAVGAGGTVSIRRLA